MRLVHEAFLSNGDEHAASEVIEDSTTAPAMKVAALVTHFFGNVEFEHNHPRLYRNNFGISYNRRLPTFIIGILRQ